MLEYPQHLETSSTFEALITSKEMKRNLELMSFLVEAQEIVSEPQPKRKRTEKPPTKVNPLPSVDPPVARIDVHEIQSDLEEETLPSSYSFPITDLAIYCFTNPGNSGSF